MDLSSASHLLAFDGYQAEVFARAFSVILSIIGPIGVIVILYYLVLSLAMTFFADRNPSALIGWATKLFLNLFIITLLLGNVFSINGFKLSPLSRNALSKFSTDIKTIYSFRWPGKGAQPVQVDAYGGLNFDAYAYLNSDVAFATLPQSNLCSTAEYSRDEMKLYKVDIYTNISNKGLRNSLETLYDITSLNKAGKSFIFLMNVFTSIGYTVSHMAELDSLGARNVQERIFSYNGLNNRLRNFSFAALRKPTEVYGALSFDSDSSAVVAATVQDFPGGVYEYASYNVRRIENPALSYTTKIVDMKEITKAADTGQFDTDISTKEPIEFQNNSEYYDANKTQIAPQLYIRTHLPLYVKSCRADLGVRANQGSYSSSEMLDILDPCKIKVKSPITQSASNTNNNINSFIGNFLQNAGSNLLNSAASGSLSLGSVFNSFSSSLESNLSSTNIISSLSNLLNFNFGFSTSNSSSCSSPKTLDEAYNEYDQLLSSDDPELKANRHCLELGKNLVGALIATEKQMRSNNDDYDDYRFGSAPNLFALNLMSRNVYAQVIDKGSINQEYGNYADFSSALRSALEPFKGLIPFDYINVQQPGVYENTQIKDYADKGQISEAKLDTGLFAVAGAIAAKAISSSMSIIKGFVSRLVGAIESIAGPIRIIAMIASLIPITAVLMFYTLAYYTAVLGSAVGIVGLPLWALMMFGKAMMNTAGSDESRQDMTLLPIGRFVFVPIGIGLEIGALGVATGMCFKFLTSILGSGGLKYLWAVLNAYMMTMFHYSLVDPLSNAVRAFAPIGVAFGMSMLPMILHSLIHGREYTPMIGNTFHGAFHQFMPMNVGAASHQIGALFRGGGLGMGQGASAAAPSSAGAADIGTTPSTITSAPTTLDQAAQKVEQSRENMKKTTL